MAKTSKIQKWLRQQNSPGQKFPGRAHSRCHRCGRPRAYIRHFGICRICFRELALTGELPGVRKASW